MEQLVKVGILSAKKINFVLHKDYFFNGNKHFGASSVSFMAGKILWNEKIYQSITFTPVSDNAFFALKDVVIGKNFHWEQKEEQKFLGTLKFIVENNKITAINIINIEDYLKSVISSEMSPTASIELLKAHTVISRSWLLAQINKNNNKTNAKNDFIENENERIIWHDREDHENFDVCADDHCQRYQGISRTYKNFEQVKQVVESTKGEILVYDNEICDTRYSKCCGGISEEFQNCWNNKKYKYLTKVRDNESNITSGKTNEINDIIPDLTQEQETVKWLSECPTAFCNNNDREVLSQVLNNYDQKTIDFYRWKVSYSRKELSLLIAERSGIDFGEVQELIPIERGVSGRLIKMKIVGTKKTMTIGKELEIRKILSKSHLYSSAFFIEIKDNIFTLHGAGWGHGVGLCQIGAAVMGNKGYNYKEILRHYYVGAKLSVIRV